jgi:drug/metabolite transporter (DMT)-like permease
MPVEGKSMSETCSRNPSARIAVSQSHRNPDLVAAAIILLGAVLFSSKAIMVKLAMQHGVEPVALLLLRLVFAAPFYVAVLGWRKYSTSEPLGVRANWLSLVSLGFVGYYLASYFDFVGLSFISASLERVILYSFPTLVLLIGAVFLKRPIRIQQVIAIAFCYGGIVIAVGFGQQHQQSANQWTGAGLIFLSALCYAIYVVGSGELIPKLGVWVFTSCAMIVSTICIVTHHLVVSPSIDLFQLPAPVYAYAVAMAFLATVIPSFLISEGIRRIGASNASIIGGIGPISTIILAVIFLGESLTVVQAIGTAFVILGVLYISVYGRAR